MYMYMYIQSCILVGTHVHVHVVNKDFRALIMNMGNLQDKTRHTSTHHCIHKADVVHVTSLSTSKSNKPTSVMMNIRRW